MNWKKTNNNISLSPSPKKIFVEQVFKKFITQIE